MDLDIRWKQRFDNFSRALVLLREPLQRAPESLSALEREGTVQRFEYVLELAWKTLKDYMEAQGAMFEPVTPKNVVKEGYAAKILADGQVWIDMLDHRNLLSHTYRQVTFEQAVQAIRDRYLDAFEGLHAWLGARYDQP
ncbi:MAG: nucleotidyltransferase substrate binding protein [Candidatus Sericytochromatia bacterium]|nr:nucleotidyltransferase substrate binding protein [Candidatus Sericytochromatia bacterium]